MRKRIIERISIKAVSTTADHIVFHVRIHFCGSLGIRNRHNTIPVSVHQQNRFCIIPDLAVNIIIPYIGGVRSAGSYPVEVICMRWTWGICEGISLSYLRLTSKKTQVAGGATCDIFYIFTT